MPAWSTEIADEFVNLAASDSRALDQLQLQALVYIAHGWRLAASGEPLTGDRPEAWIFGPMYRKLADALAAYGRSSVTQPIPNQEGSTIIPRATGPNPIRSRLDSVELDLITDIYQHYGRFEWSRLATITACDDSPWQQILQNGAGRFRDIPHELVRSQFAEVLRKSAEARTKA